MDLHFSYLFIGHIMWPSHVVEKLASERSKGYKLRYKIDGHFGSHIYSHLYFEHIRIDVTNSKRLHACQQIPKIFFPLYTFVRPPQKFHSFDVSHMNFHSVVIETQTHLVDVLKQIISSSVALLLN